MKLTENGRSGHPDNQQAHYLTQIYKDIPVGLCFLDCDLRYLLINDWLAALNGIPADDHLGRRISEVLPDVATGVELHLRSVIEKGEPIIGGTVDAKTPAHRGLIRSFQHNYFPVKSDDGTVVGVSCVVEDITDRKRMEAALLKAKQNTEKANKDLDSKVEQRTDELRDANRKLKSQIAERKQILTTLQESKMHLRHFLESTSAAPWEANAKTWVFTYVGPQVVKLLGYPREHWLEENFWVDHIHPEDREWAIDYCLKSLTRQQNYQFEYRMIAANGRSVWLQDIVNVVKQNGEPVALRGFIIDITEGKRLEEAHRDVTGRLINAQEEERSRIARDLHDDFSQELALMAIELDRLGKKLPKSDVMLRQTVQDLLDRNQKIANGLHSLSHSLHPSNIENLGFEKEVESFCENFSDQHDIRIEFTHSTIPRTIPGDVALCLYRIIQEAMQNVLKHSGADEARIEVTGNPTSVRLSISDSGMGFDPELVRSKSGLGLVSMQERLRLVGGWLSVESQEAQGTRIDIQVPLVQEKAE